MPYQPADERSRQIVEAASVVIARDGLHRATTRRVAAEAGVALPSLHYSFRDKTQMIGAVYEHWTDMAGERLAHLVPEGCGLEAGIRNLLTGLFDLHAADATQSMAQFELFFWGLRTPSAGDLARQFYTSYVAVCAAALDRASNGQHDRDTLESLSGVVFCVLDGLLIKTLSVGPERARDDLERFQEILKTLVVNLPQRR